MTPKVRTMRLSGVAVFLISRGAELAVSLQDDINFFRVAVAVKVEIRFQPGVLVALYDFGDCKVFKQGAAHGAALRYFRR